MIINDTMSPDSIWASGQIPPEYKGLSDETKNLAVGVAAYALGLTTAEFADEVSEIDRVFSEVDVNIPPLSTTNAVIVSLCPEYPDGFSTDATNAKRIALSQFANRRFMLDFRSYYSNDVYQGHSRSLHTDDYSRGSQLASQLVMKMSDQSDGVNGYIV